MPDSKNIRNSLVEKMRKKCKYLMANPGIIQPSNRGSLADGGKTLSSLGVAFSIRGPPGVQLNESARFQQIELESLPDVFDVPHLRVVPGGTGEDVHFTEIQLTA